MANATTMTVTLKAVSDFSDVKTNVSQLKNAFSQLKLPSDLKGQFSNIFSGLEKDVSKASEMMSKGFRTTGDVSKFETVVDKISKGFRDLQAAASEVSPDMVLDSFTNTPELENAISKLKELTKAWKDLRTSGSNDATKKIEDSLKSLRDVSKNKSIEKFKEAFETLDFSKMEEAFKELQKGGDYFAEGSKNGQIYKDTVEELGKAFEQLDANTELKDLGRQLQEAGGDINQLSEEGRNNLLKMIEQLIGKLPQVSDEVDKLGKNSKDTAQDSQQLSSSLQSFANKAKYFLGLENAVRLFKRAVREAFETVKELDAVMTETAVVTEFNVGDMWEQLPEYTARAKELGVGLKDTYESATIFYQQGLNTAQVNQLSTETLKMARIAGLDAAEATDRMTNALRGFNMELNQTNAQRVSDVYSKLAAITASDTDEISTAMTKVASLANSANMSFESTAAFLSQIIETTRESAETAGTALKTIVARFSEVKKLYSEGELLGTDSEGEEVNVNRVSEALHTAGIDLNEYISGAKGLDDILIELASKWDSLSLVQQRYIATMAAGSRQQSRFIALMSDYDRTLELVGAANNANGASNQQYGKTLESLRSKLNNLKTSWQTFLMGIANNEVIKDAVDLLTKLLDTINKLTGTGSGLGKFESILKIGAAFGALKLGQKGLNGLLGRLGEGLSGKGRIGGLLGQLLSSKGGKAEIGLADTLINKMSDVTQFLKKNSYDLVPIFETSFQKIKTSVVNTFTSMKDSAKIFSLYTKDMVKSLASTIKTTFTSLLTTLAAHPIIAVIVAIGAAIASVVAAGAIADEIQYRRIKKAEEAYEEEKQKLEEIESELDNYSQKLAEAKERVAELNMLKTDGSITAIQNTELKNLERQIELYKLQIKVLKEKKEIEEKKTQEAGGDNYYKKYMATGSLGGLKKSDEYLKEYVSNFWYNYHRVFGSNFIERSKVGSRIDQWVNQLDLSTIGTMDQLINNTYAALSDANNKLKEQLEKGEDTTLTQKIIDTSEEFLGTYIPQMFEEASQLTYQTGNNLSNEQLRINNSIENAYRHTAKYLSHTGDVEGAYEVVFNNPSLAKGKKSLQELVEKFKNNKEGAEGLGKAINDLYRGAEGGSSGVQQLINSLYYANAITGTDIESFNQLANQLLANNDLFESGADAISNWSSRLNEAKTEREAFEEKIKDTGTGTENFESYAKSYEEFMKLAEDNSTLDNPQFLAYAERLLGRDRLIKLNGDVEAITNEIKNNLSGVFEDPESKGRGLITKLEELSEGWTDLGDGSKAWIKNGITLAKLNSDGKWFLNTEEGLSDVAEAFGMTNQQIIACIEALSTVQSISHENTDSILSFLGERGATTESGGQTKVFKAQAMLEWTEEGKSFEEQLQLLHQLANDENVILVDVELTGDSETDLKNLTDEDGGLLSKHKTHIRNTTTTSGGQLIELDAYATDSIDALTAAYAYANISVEDFFKTFNGKDAILERTNGKMYSNTEILNSLIKAYSNGQVDLTKFYKEVDDVNGKTYKVLNIQELSQTLIDAGFTQENIDAIFDKLLGEGHYIDFNMRFTPQDDTKSIKDLLKGWGLLNSEGQVDVEAAIKFGVAEGYDKETVQGWLESLKSHEDITLTISNEDEISNKLNAAYVTPVQEANVQLTDLQNNINGFTTITAQNAMGELAKSMDGAVENARSIYNYITNLPKTVTTSVIVEKLEGMAKGKHVNDNYEGTAITGEEGPELRIGDGYAEILGANGPQFTHVDKDDVIYTASETKKILSSNSKDNSVPGFREAKDPPKLTKKALENLTIKAKEKELNALKTQLESGYTVTGSTGSGTYGDGGGGGDSGGGGSRGGGSSGGSGSSSASSATSKGKEAWDKFYKDLKHQREMDEINDAEYYAALEANYRNYLDTSEENLDTWNSVVEEIYKGNYSTLTKAWNDELSEWDHKIAMEQATEVDKLEWMKNNNEKYLSDNAQQHKDYEKALEDIHKGEVDAQKNAFNEGKEALEHALAMDLIKEKEYYEKVDELAQKTLVGNQKEIIKERQKHDEDMHKHEIDTQKEAWSKRQADLEYELEMGKITQEQYWKDYEASYKEILVSSADEVADERLDAERELQKGIKELEKKTFDERLSNWERFYNAGNVKQKEYLAGLTRTLNTEYIQRRSLSEDKKKEKEQALFDVSAGYEDMASNNASALEKMHDLVIKQIQSEKKAEMEAIDVKIKDLKTVADARKQAIDDIEKENDYLKEQRGLQKTAAQLEAELEMMKSDTSAAGMAKRRKLEAQLAAQKEKIADSEHKHSIEAQKDQIDKQTQMQTDALEAQKKAIEDYTNNEAKISEDAWIKMNVAAQSEMNMSKFFDDLTNWAKKAGLDIQDEISTTVAGFETAMDESQNNFINSMAAYEEAGLGPREMLQSLADSGVDVSKVLTEMDEMGMDNEWSDDVKGLLATRLQAKGVTNEQVASAAQVSADDIDVTEGMGQKTALDMAAQMEGVGLGWEEAQEALNKYMAAQGRDVKLSAKGWRDLALQLTDNNVSMTDLSSAMHTYGKNTQEWLAATSKVDASVNAALILKAKYGEVQTSINSMKSAYGAYEMDMLASGQKVIPAVDSFTTRATQIVKNGALTVDQKLEALQTETEERWDNSTFGQITAEQQATIDANLQKLKDDYGLSDTQIQAGWDAVENGVMTPEELAEASTKLLELGTTYDLSDKQIQAGWDAVTSGQLSATQLANVGTSLAALKGKYDLSNQTIGGLWNQVTAGTLTPQQLENARLSCVELEKKFSTSKDTINGIWGQIANGQLNATDFTTFSTKLDGLATKTDTDKKTINTLLGQVASGAIDGTKLPAVTGIIGGLDKIYESGLADANNTNTVLNAIATGKIDPNKLNAVNDIVGLLGTIPAGADGARKLVNEALSNIAKGKDVDISALKKKTEEMQEELMDVTYAANNADLSVKSIGTGKQTITADTEGALKARAALRAASKLDTYTDAEMKYLDADGDGKVTAADARIWLRRGAKLEGYASGTSSVPSSGTYRIDEGMQDELIYDPSQNALLSYLNRRSIVFPADVSRTMKQLFFNPDLLSPSISAPSAPSMEASINNTTCGDIHMGDIVINGNTDQKTIAQIRAEQKRQARYIGDIFERDQRFMTNI